jgi:hypothetical protein
MVPALSFPPRRKPRLRLFCSLLGAFALSGAWLLADASPPSSGGDDFASYLAQHQADLVPFFTQNGAMLIKEALPITVHVMGHVLLVTALVCWFIDVVLGWIFSTMVAPAYAKITRALVYASGRLVLALALTFVLGVAATVGLNAGAGWPALLMLVVLTVPAIAVQIFWIGWLYRASARDSGLFYIGLLLVHTVVGAILVASVFSGQIDHAVAQYVDQSITPRLQVAADAAQQEVAPLTSARNAAQAQLTALQDRLAQDKTDEASLHQAIADGKNLPAFTYSRLLLLRAQGHLIDAATGLAAFIASHPHDPETEPARGQLAELNQEVSVQLTAQRQEQAAAARAAARARAHLLARAAAGQSTLSEMRAALLGKTPAQVFALFGEPTERGADRWGYGRAMVLDPDTSTARGLTVVFADGFVQGVDYYYRVDQ